MAYTLLAHSSLTQNDATDLHDLLKRNGVDVRMVCPDIPATGTSSAPAWNEDKNFACALLLLDAADGEPMPGWARLIADKAFNCGRPVIPVNTALMEEHREWRTEHTGEPHAVQDMLDTVIAQAGRALPAVCEAEWKTKEFNGDWHLTDVTVRGNGGDGCDGFQYCRNLRHVTIDEGIDVIFPDAFRWCNKLEDVSFSASVDFIFPPAFQSCNEIKRFTVALENESYQAIDGVLYMMHKGKLFRLTRYPSGSRRAAYRVHPDTRWIADGAFQGAHRLKVIELPEKLEKIGDEAFTLCNVVALTIPESVKKLGKGTMRFCTELSMVTLPSQLTSIPKDTFLHCKSLQTITIPSSVTEIGQKAFKWCTALTSLRLPRGVKKISEDAFAECPHLTLEVAAGSYAERYAKENGIPYTTY